MNATLVIRNAKVWTADPRRPSGSAIAINGERIVAVGNAVDVEHLIDSRTRVIDARGQLVTPGFIDSHLHFLMAGLRLASVQLRDAHSREELVRRVREHAARMPKGSWITGGDWDHENWGGILPSREWIDEVTPDHPVWMTRLDGHMALANSAALRLAGVTRETEEIGGGEIVRDTFGHPTGILKDNAMPLVQRVVPEPDYAMKRTAMRAAMKHVAAQGVTSAHNMAFVWEDLDFFRQMHAEGELKTRIYAAVPLAQWERAADDVARNGRGDHWLRSGVLKGFVDGSLGSHTAAFYEPFEDQHDSCGILLDTPDNLYQYASQADRAGLHLCVHAIGDRAAALQLDIYERIIRENGPRDRRFRIEHAQHLRASDIARFGELGIIASMQPYHLIDDGRWAARVLGADRLRTAFAFRSLLDGGARLAFGSDWFVAPPTPLEGIYAAVTRRTLDDRHPGGLIPEEKISVEEALVAYTRDAAYASFEDDVKGTLAPGRLADLTIIADDILSMEPERLREARVATTIVGGEVVFSAAEA